LVRHFIPAIRHVGCIVENPELYPFLSGRENLELFARMAEIPFERIEEVVRLVELEHRIDDLVKTYSLGMKQRLGIAQALLGKPRLLILDEPTNGLDPAGIRELRAFIHRLAREEGISVFISSHILSEVQLLCDRVAIIHQGRVVKTGSVEELIGGQTRVEWKMEPLEQGIALLKELPYVADVETVGEQVRAQMPPEQVADANERLIRSGVRVHAVHPLQPTLEEIFLQETGGSHNAPAGI
jgi:ABC-2 type transport system ATP-binding protein